MKKVLLFFTIFFIIKSVYSQSFIYDFFDITTKPDTIFNFYVLSDNPALLNFDLDDEKLKTSVLFNSNFNKLKRFFIPEKIEFYEIQFCGKKRTDKNQIFKGRFSFNKEIRKNWNWIFSKDFTSGNPFLLGDSSTGSSVFNGIFFDASYFNHLSDRFTLGAQVEYFVDEGFKKVSPKPISQHRIFNLKLGAGYSFSEDFSAGLAFQTEDNKEEISYKEDESAVYKEITLLKFQGFDYPVVIKKKTETRIGYLNHYSIDGHFLLNPSTKFQLMGKVRKGIEQIIQKEEINNPQGRGHFANDYLKFSLISNSNIFNQLNFITSFEYFLSESWSRHPDYFVVLAENYNDFIKIKGNLKYNLNSKISFFAGIGTAKFTMNISDYYSNVFFDLKTHLYSFLSGLRYNLNDKISIKSILFIEKNTVKKSTLKFYNTGYYFTFFLINDFNYFSSDYFKYEIGISIQVNVKNEEFILDLNYINLNPTIYYNTEKKKNSMIQSKLIYRTRIY